MAKNACGCRKLPRKSATVASYFRALYRIRGVKTPTEKFEYMMRRHDNPPGTEDLCSLRCKLLALEHLEATLCQTG